MKHRFLVFGRDLAVDIVAGNFGKLGQDAVVVRTEQEAVAHSRRVAPSVLVIVGDAADTGVREIIATFSVEASTQALPIFLVGPVTATTAAVDLLSSGVSGVIRADLPAEAQYRLITDVIGTIPGDAARIWAALDHRGPAVLRRLARFFTDDGRSARVTIVGAGEPATVSFKDGDFENATFGPLSGTEAASALLASHSVMAWRFVIEDAAAIDVTDDDISISMDVVFGTASSEADESSIDLIIEEAGSLPPPVPLATPSADVLKTLPPSRILIVDDEPDILSLYARALAQTGAQVTTANDGEAGFAAALKSHPDLILSDIMMPRTDGWGFLAQVRNDHRLKETPFVLFSCHGDYLASLKRLQAGAEDYLEKGVRPSSLVERVTQVLLPRRSLEIGAKPGRSFSGTLIHVGPKFLLRKLSTARMTGTLKLSTRGTEVTLDLLNGTLVDASSTILGVQSRAEDALTHFLALDDAPYTFVSRPPSMGGMTVFFPDVEEKIVAHLNASRTMHDEGDVAADHPLIFDRPELLAFYRTAAPDPARPLVEALVKGTTPRKLLMVSEVSPLLVEAVVKDLLRKRVARFVH